MSLRYRADSFQISEHSRLIGELNDRRQYMLCFVTENARVKGRSSETAGAMKRTASTIRFEPERETIFIL